MLLLISLLSEARWGWVCRLPGRLLIFSRTSRFFAAVRFLGKHLALAFMIDSFMTEVPIV